MRKLLFPTLLLLTASAQAKITTYDWTAIVKEPTTSFDWSGQDAKPSWTTAIGDMMRGTFKIDDQAPLEAEGVYQNAASLDFTLNGQHFVSSSHEWFVNSQFQGVGSHLMSNDDGTLTMNLDWGFPKMNPLDLTLQEATHIVGGGSFGSDTWEGSVESNFSGLIDSIHRRDDLAWGGDSAPTPEPSTFVFGAVSLLGFLGVTKGRNAARKRPQGQTPASSYR